MEKDTGTETETETEKQDDETEKHHLSSYGRFCARKGINPNLIMLKITLFVMYGGKLVM